MVERKNDSLWAKVQTIALLLMLIILTGMGIKSCVLTENSEDKVLQEMIDQNKLVLDQVRSANEMKLNQLREDMYNTQVKHERDVALLKQRMELIEGKSLSSSQTVNVGNVNTNQR